MTVSKNNKVLQLLHAKMRVILCDKRTFIGEFVAYDKHMNLVLINCTEYKKYKPSKSKLKEPIEVKKTLGVVILRGESVMSIIVESEPPSRSSSYGGSSSRYSSR
ncbi:small nuclear ribonucleoprotein-associated protein B-like [Stegodyphus dumicola]|uniref:small nuclear ribonucleoprotein-associated protein B-like n=1 Tax=Stegodyphus dumicola TaxID=202533 RepID=UPI0015AF7DA8|nr:small nuclear ribonucleoprotein-associated protein B-like [Stegodyphus dumicola]